MSSIRVEQISGRACDATEHVCSSIDNSICSLLDDSNFQWHFLHSPIHSSFQFCCLFTSFIDSDSSCQLLQLKVQHSEKIAFQNQTVTSEGLIRTDWLQCSSNSLPINWKKNSQSQISFFIASQFALNSYVEESITKAQKKLDTRKIDATSHSP